MPTDTPPEAADILTAAPDTVSLDLSDESATTALFRAALGPVGADHYLPVFARFELADRAGSSWNWAACLCTVGWMLFRRMGGAALAYVGLVAGLLLAGAALAGLVFSGLAQVQIGIGLALLLLMFAVPGVYGDAWLYAHCRKRMARALADSRNWTDAAALLEAQAPARRRGWWLALGHAAVLGAAAAVVQGQPQLPAPGSGAPQVGAAPGASAASAASAPVASPVAEVASVAVAAAKTASSTGPAGAAPAPAPAAPAPALIPSSATVPVAVAEPVAAASALVQTPRPVAVPARAASVPVAAPSRAASEPVAAPSRAASAPVRTLAPDRPYLVNVGVFAVDANARKAHAKLRAAGVPALVQELQTRDGKRTRVRAGPFQNRAQAEAAAQRIHSLGLEAVVVEPPSGAAR